MRDLLTPSSFHDDWYGWATNQMGHAMIGMAMACVLTVAYFYVAGEFPFKWHLFAVISCGYAAWELAVQKWQGWDTVEDWLFVCAYGAGGAILAVSEYHVGSLVADLDLRQAVWAFLLFAGHLAVGIALRLRRADD
jgi:hypothetical protein